MPTTTSKRILRMEVANFAHMNNVQIGILSGNDSDMSIRTLGYKDGAGNSYTTLVKSQHAPIKSLTISDFGTAGFLKNDAAGVISGGNAVLASDIEDGTFTTGSVMFMGSTSLAEDNTNFFWDDSNNRLGVGIAAPSTDVHIESASSGLPILTIENTNADATSGSLKFLKDGASAADADSLGKVSFNGDDSGAVETEYGRIEGLSADVSNGIEDGSIVFSTIVAGSFTENVRIAGGFVGIGTNSPDEQLHLLSSTASKPVIKIENTTEDTNEATVRFFKNRGGLADATATLAGDNVGSLRFMGYNNGATQREYSGIYANCIDPVNGSEDSKLQFFTYNAGTRTEIVSIVSGDVGFNNASPEELIDMQSSVTAKPVLRIENTNADATSGELKFVKDSVSPADDDSLGKISFNGDDDGGVETEVARIEGLQSDVTAASDDGAIAFNLMKSGTIGQHFTFYGTRLGIGTLATVPTNELEMRSSFSGTPSILFENTTASTSSSNLIFSKNRGNASDGTSTSSADRLGYLQFRGWDSAGNVTVFASIRSFADDVTSTSEDGSIIFDVFTGGAFATVATIITNAIYQGDSMHHSFGNSVTTPDMDLYSTGTQSRINSNVAMLIDNDLGNLEITANSSLLILDGNSGVDIEVSGTKYFDIGSAGITPVNNATIHAIAQAGAPTSTTAGALWLDTDASANGDLMCYGNSAWRKVISLP